jgi:perosamine synthetase
MSCERPVVLGGEPVNPAGPAGWPVDDRDVADAIAAAVADGSWGRYHGPHGDRWRDALAAYHEVRHVHLCASGTSALELALRGVGVGPGEEVILAAYDFEANFKDVLALEAVPLLVDVRSDDVQMNVDAIEAAASDRVVAVIASHLHGGCVDMRDLRSLCDRRGWSLIEDACQSPGAVVQGRRAGTGGDAGVLSFGGSKLLTAGRGGAVLTNRDDVLQRIRLHVYRGNDLSPLSELQAAALLPQLARLDERNAIRAKNVQRLRTLLNGRPGLSMLPEASHAPAYYKVGFWYDSAAFGGLERDGFAAAVRAEGVALWPGFRSLHRVHSRRRFRASGELPVADAADERLLVLHHPVLLEDDAAIVLVAAAIEKIGRFAGEIRDAGKRGA